MSYKAAMTIFPLFLAFVAFGKIISAEETQRCPAFAAQRSIYGMMLKGHVYETAMVGIGLECVSMCRADDRCQSFNFVISRHLCEFNNRTKEARPKDFLTDPDRLYYTKDINRVPLGSISDLAAESCEEIKAGEPQATSGKFWLSTIKRGMVLEANCDMKAFDVDECSASYPVCDKNGICNNTIGSYNCTCKPGYSPADGKKCKDIDECQTSRPCHLNATCHNTDGSYSCSCKTSTGFVGDGKRCVLQNAPAVTFVRCWRAQTGGWVASTFHNNCNGRGPTVTIIQVGGYVFGGYTSTSWSSSCGYASSSKSFIYSLHNVNGYYPIKLQIKSGHQGNAIYRCAHYGPTFGAHDIYIHNNAASHRGSFTNCGISYHLPPGYSSANSSCHALFAGSQYFTPTDVEVFYETTA